MDNVLRHAAIIMDGNGRWAKQRGLPRTEGHKKGAEKVQIALETAREIGLQYLTLYAFSTENWNRPPEEVNALMELLVYFLDEKLPYLMKNNVRLLATGRIDQLPETAVKKLRFTEEKTAGNTSGTLILALNYGGRAEIVDAAKKLMRKTLDGAVKPEDLDEETFSRELYLPQVPPVDLMIRTGGEKRISNFLIWENAYAELYFTSVLWPDFGREEFLAAAEDFRHRGRRFGRVSETTDPEKL